MTCKTLEQVVLHSKAVQDAIKAKGVVALRADITEDNPEAYALLEELGNSAHSIPFLAVFCPDRPKQPRVLADWFTREDLLTILSACPDPPTIEVPVNRR
ncbi:MAG: thioredoxin family protein [Planctomycetes bacterium]|nr:thioredoxin family protein [Planctomycetota bacterium]